MQAQDGPKRSSDHRHYQQQQQPPAAEVSNCGTCNRTFVQHASFPPASVSVTVWLWLLCCCSFVVVPARAGPPRYSSRIVETKSGAIRGVILELNSKHLEPVEVFKAVPYATPPTGNLRFEAPKKLSPWTGTKLADTYGPVCPQSFPDISNRTAALLSMPKGRYQHLKRLLPLLANQSEDCLTLNIYVPGSGSRGLEAPYSIFFYIHGESYDWGSGNPYDGSVLASYGHVIVVTVNFRLGILGFLKTRASLSPGSGGNLGLMDIILALHWVRDNIASFGGDSKRITVVGHDTGAALANLVLISKSGKGTVDGLVQRAVLLSGSALSPWALIPDPDTVRLEVSQQMACHLVPGHNNRKPTTDDITDCLRDKPIEALMGVRLTNVRFMPSWGPFLPLEDSLDPEFAMEHSGEGFITSELMLGMTTTESYNDFSASDIQYGLEEDQRNRLLRTYIRNAFTFHLNEIFSAVRNEYTDWDKPIQHPINIRDSTMEALSDGHTVAPSIKVAYLHARRGAKTYMFHFGYQSKESEYPQRLGSVRGEELPYIFGLPLVQGLPAFPQNYSRQDMGVNEAVLNFVTNFCKTGDPNEAGQQQIPLLHPDYGTAKERTRFRLITWETYETTTQQYLSISTKPKMRSHYRGHKMALWLNLIPQLHRPGDPEVSMRHHHFREREPHYYAGTVRAESFSRPKSLYQNGLINDAQESRQESFGTECTPDPTMGEVLQEGNGGPGDGNSNVLSEEEEEELLEKLANRHYYSYTAALGVTVGVGCLLLLLNMLIFAGIYYQRDRTKRKSQSGSANVTGGSGATSGTSASVSDINGTPDESEIPLTNLPSPSPVKSKRSIEPPPSYATLPKQRNGNNSNASAGSIHHQHHHHHLHQYNQHAAKDASPGSSSSPPSAGNRSGTSTLGRCTGGSACDSSSLAGIRPYPHQQQQAMSPHSSGGHTSVTITPPATITHHQTLPRAAKAPLPPIRTTPSVGASAGPTSSCIAPLTSILVNNNNAHQHHYQQQQQQQQSGNGATQQPPSSSVITVDLVNCTNSAKGGSASADSPQSAVGHQHHHHHHHHHHGTPGRTGDGSGTSNSAGSVPNTSTLKKRVQIQEVTV
ncbi:neuroligin-4, X-linked-like isoform X1 [Anopheles albimanus]|nr:neuroligin-4, X-linked-like isoform X1 [Anopheles albimanus]XP_035784426.1 neuroligin-4, X-linked-like isoform X1 [Anopheles albimanus]XP_035784427.1 neuroligin-4, X-linked-like isoform X1 [Anopheles albimanus]XP_035784428.1 neuroligin-4, X-linked-like isoform X1 [Anopheles albimanus]XP_035784429.1 neuroligin-4, X-linked-like isoform X1 [Anopheles albimanus]XP_035784430.1 neuroligin-4, X-linked-like isoform X1 [Anopheles albimanus]XP_035784431.1 neuroligin-4, X-linked-like isoform X1 [Anop